MLVVRMTAASFAIFFINKARSNIRTLLIRANLEHVRRGNPPIIKLDPYIEVFEEGYGSEKPDWWLARDLGVHPNDRTATRTRLVGQKS